MPDTNEIKTNKQGLKNKNLEPNAEGSEEPEDEVHLPTPFIDNILEMTFPLIRTELLEYANFVVCLRITMSAAAQEKVEEINAHLNLLPGPRELEDILE